MHENQMHEESCFLTLTYNEESLPEHGSLRPSDHRNFLNRLRRRLIQEWESNGSWGPKPRVRYYHCGEYGEKDLRPHFHTILFGHSYSDRIPWSTSPSGATLYRSPSLESDWSFDGKPLGHALLGDVTFESAQYVAKYTTKKRNVSKASSEKDYRAWESRYQRCDPATGEILEIHPEYSTGSNRPGIGKPWFDRYWRDVYPHDEVIVNGKPIQPPRYYDQLLERMDPNLYQEVKAKRLEQRSKTDDSPERLEALETCALARTSLHGKRN